MIKRKIYEVYAKIVDANDISAITDIDENRSKFRAGNLGNSAITLTSPREIVGLHSVINKNKEVFL